MVAQKPDSMWLVHPSEPTRLHIATDGSGPAVILAHGFGGSARNFMPQARALRSSHKIWLYDTRGHARSSAPETEGAYDWSALVGDFDRVARAALGDATNAGARPFVVGGLSLGAATALFWALQTDLQLDGLVLAAYPESDKAQRDWATAFATAIEADGLEIAGERFVWGPGAAFGHSDASAIRRGFMEHAPRALTSILRLALANIPDIVSLAPALGALRVPTLIVVGGDDERSRDASRTLSTCLPRSHLAIIENAGHVVNLSQPAAFNNELSQFIEDLSSVAPDGLRE